MCSVLNKVLGVFAIAYRGDVCFLYRGLCGE